MKLHRRFKFGGLLLRPRYFKLALLYFILCAALGVFLAYWPPYLRSIGFNSAEIGGIVAAGLISRSVAPYVFGWWADHSGKITHTMLVASVLGTFFFSLSMFDLSFAAMVVVIFLFSFFWDSLLPQMDALTLTSLGHSSEHYSLLRLWGSVGFIAGVIGAAPFLDLFGVQLVPWSILSICVLMCVLVRHVEGRRRKPPKTSAPIRPTIVRPEVYLLLAVCFLMQLSHGPYYAFFSIYAGSNGYGKLAIGSLWSLAVLAEIAIFLFSAALLSRATALHLLTWSVALTVVRWLLTGWFIQNPLILGIAQIMHAVTFGLYHIAAIELVRRHFSDHLRTRGQALYTGISFGLGGALGSFLTGRFWDELEGEIYLLSAAVAMIAVVLCLLIGRLKQATPQKA